MAWIRPEAVIAACGPMALLLCLSTPARAQFPPTACSLLSPAEVEQVLHVPMGPGSPRVNAGNLTSCLFTARGGGKVSILLRRNASRNWIAEQRYRMSGASTFRPLGGLGDSAFVLDRRGQGAALCVFRGEYYLQISAFGTGGASDVLPATEELARKALSRM